MIFSVADCVIIAGYVILSMAAGLYGKRYISGLSDFLVAGRGVGTYLGIATLAATEIGTVTFMYYAELGYKTGFASFVNGLIAGCVMILVLLVWSLSEAQYRLRGEFPDESGLPRSVARVHRP